MQNQLFNNKFMIGKFCLTSTASFEKINKAQTNRSITKQTFSFQKTSRFQEPKPVCPLNTYDGNILNKFTSGNKLGRSSRSDFTKCLTVSPSSNKYKLKTFWEQNIAKNKGCGFGLSRERVSFNNYIPKQPQLVPSASAYNNQKINKINSPNYTLRSKTIVIDKTMSIGPQNTNPGPGKYINPEMETNSKFQKITYGQAKSRRFQTSQTIAPGPGKYKQINDLSKKGTYILSNAKGGTKAKFDNEKRQTFCDKIFNKQLNNPGPGYYQMPSEFGQYDGDIYNDFRATKRSNGNNGWVVSQRKIKK